MTPSLALSPDGSMLAFVGSKSAQDKSMIYLRRLDQLKAAPLTGTEGAADPFFLPQRRMDCFLCQHQAEEGLHPRRSGHIAL